MVLKSAMRIWAMATRSSTTSSRAMNNRSDRSRCGCQVETAASAPTRMANSDCTMVCTTTPPTLLSTAALLRTTLKSCAFRSAQFSGITLAAASGRAWRSTSSESSMRTRKMRRSLDEARWMVQYVRKTKAVMTSTETTVPLMIAGQRLG